MNREEARKKAEALVAQMDVLEAATQLRYDAPALDRLHIPEYNWWNEALHGVARAGVATSFPQAIGMAAAFDPDMVERLDALCVMQPLCEAVKASVPVPVFPIERYLEYPWNL